MKTNIKKLPKSQLEIEFEVSTEEFKKHVDHALLRLQEHIKIDGFRPGQVPLKIVEERAGKENLLMEAGDLAVKESYSKFVTENKLEPIGEPEVQILKIAGGNPFLFKVKITILPEVELPDYKKIVSQIKKKEIFVNQEEIDDALNYIRKSRAKFSQLDRPAQEKDFVEIEYESPRLKETQGENSKKIKDEFILGEGKLISGFESNLVGMKAGEEKEFSLTFPQNSLRKDLAGQKVDFKVKMIAVQKVELPEINDEFARGLGKFDNIESLKGNIKEGIIIEKEMQEKQRQRNEMLEKITQKSKIEIPEVLINLEKERLFKDFQQKINQSFSTKGGSPPKADASLEHASGGKTFFQEYLASIRQDEQSLRDSFLKEAEKKVKNFLILKEIGKKENILVNENEVEEETSKTIKNYPVDFAKKIDIDGLKEYIKGVIYNEKVFEKLESFVEI